MNDPLNAPKTKKQLKFKIIRFTTCVSTETKE